MNKTKVIKLCFPRNTLPISITKEDCQLKCKHCNGQLLKGMKHLAVGEGEHEASSFLVSGGCNSQGQVPVLDYWNEIKELKKEGRTNVHWAVHDRGVGCLWPRFGSKRFVTDGHGNGALSASLIGSHTHVNQGAKPSLSRLKP